MTEVSEIERVESAEAVWITAPRTLELRSETVALPRGDEVTIKAVASLVSAGTAIVVYRGDASAEPGPAGSEKSAALPLKYRGQTICRVTAAGPDSSLSVGQLVLAYSDQSAITVSSGDGLLAQIPAGLPLERAVFAHLLTVALTSVLDVPIRFGDCVAVFGQGTVGSFIAQLARRTAGTVVVVDPLENRRQLARRWGADAAEPPESAERVIETLTEGRGVDIAFDASGSPAALQSAINCTGDGGTIVAVSYFGAKPVPLVLAPEFHFRRQHIVSSQTNPFTAEARQRWSWERVREEVFELLQSDWLLTPPITHRMPFHQVADAFRLLDEHPDGSAGVLLEY